MDFALTVEAFIALVLSELNDERVTLEINLAFLSQKIT